MVRDPLQHGVDARTFTRDVLDGARVARENGEELHRHNGRRAHERLDDSLVGDRGTRDPVKVAQAAINRVCAVPIEGRIGDDEPQPAVHVDETDATHSGMTAGRAGDCRGRTPRRRDQAKDVGSSRSSCHQ